MIQIGGVHTTFCQEEGILLQKYRDRNGRCIAILFKSIGVRGRLDSPDALVLSGFKGALRPIYVKVCKSRSVCIFGDFMRIFGLFFSMLATTFLNQSVGAANRFEVPSEPHVCSVSFIGRANGNGLLACLPLLLLHTDSCTQLVFVSPLLTIEYEEGILQHESAQGCLRSPASRTSYPTI